MKITVSFFLILVSSFYNCLYAQSPLYGIHTNSYGQSFVVKINPKNGASKKVAKLAGKIGIASTGSAFDAAGGRYFATVSTDSQYLAVCDVNTGTLNHITIGDTFGIDLQYDNSSGKLYGLYSSLDSFLHLAYVNPSGSGITSVAKTMAKSVGYSTFDQKNGYFILSYEDKKGMYRMSAIDVSTGSETWNWSIDTLNWFTNIVWNSNDGKIYGIAYNQANKTEYMLSIDPSNGHFHTLFSFKDIKSIEYTDAAIDEANNRYSFIASDTNEKTYLYTADLTANAVKWRPLEPSTVTNLELHYNSSSAATFPAYSPLYGTVDNAKDQPLSGATMYLKDSNGLYTDSMIADQNGNYLFSMPTYSGTYISAKPWSISDRSDLPTYYGSVVSIHDAKWVKLLSDTKIDYKTLAANSIKGQTVINGNITLSQNCDKHPGGKAAPNVMLFLADSNGTPQYETMSDSIGNFTFQDVQNADYTIWTDNINIDNANSNVFVKIKSGTYRFSDLQVALCTDKLSMIDAGTGINDDKRSFMVKVLSNPISDELAFEYAVKDQTTISFAVTDIMGKTVYTVPEFLTNPGTHTVNIPTPVMRLKSGLYFLNFRTANSNSVIKIICR